MRLHRAAPGLMRAAASGLICPLIRAVQPDVLVHGHELRWLLSPMQMLVQAPGPTAGIAVDALAEARMMLGSRPIQAAPPRVSPVWARRLCEERRGMRVSRRPVGADFAAGQVNRIRPCAAARPPAPFSAMNTTPAASRAVRIAVSVEGLEAAWPISKRLIVT
jgi:hypothetical protein